MRRTAIAFDPRVKNHDTGPGHPERAARYTAVIAGLKASGLLSQLTHLPARSATVDELGLVHPLSYVDLVDREVAQNRRQLSTGDTSISPASAEVARIVVGCALAAVDAVFTGQAANAFCATRPPGHHASAARGMGFCLFNAVAIAARYAQSKYSVARVAIIDWDVHHGNGTQDIFYQDGSVLFFSTHQWPLYPGTGAQRERGEGPGLGTTINCPFGPGAGAAEILGAFDEQFVPAVEAFRPDLILISAGFDSRIGDPLGQFTLNDDDFSSLTRKTMELAARFCQDRIVSVLEGGYNIDGLTSATQAHVQALLG